MSSSLRFLALFGLLGSAIGAASSAAAQDDGVLLWLASGRYGAACGNPIACDIAGGYACIGGHCWPAGQAGQSCRPTDHPSGRGCDIGLACEDSVCVEAGGQDEPCLPCDENDQMSTCLLDRCDYGLACEQSTFRCVPAGAEGQPCREEDAACNPNMECVGGACLAVGGPWEPCGSGNTCRGSLFCETEADEPQCVIHPRGLVAGADSTIATRCVDDVEAQFAALANRGEGYTVRDYFDAREGDRLPPSNAKVAAFDTDIASGDIFNLEPNRDHMQGICKLPGAGDKYVFTRNADPDDGAAGIMIADRSQARFFYPVANTPHPGGLSMFGHKIAYGVEHGSRTLTICSEFGGAGCNEQTDQDVGWVDFWRYRPENAASPLVHEERYYTGLLPGNGNRPSSVAYTNASDGSPLFFMLGRASSEAWLIQKVAGRWQLLQYFPKMTQAVAGGVWRMFQNIHFVTDCSGTLYLIATAREPGIGNSNYADLMRLEATGRGKYTLRKLKSWKFHFDSFYCEARYAANPVVRDGELSFVCSGGLSDIEGDLGITEIRR